MLVLAALVVAARLIAPWFRQLVAECREVAESVW